MEEAKAINKPWIVLLPIGVAALILAIDDGILNLALPSIAGEFKASVSQLQWAVNAYLLTFAALMLTMGALGDRLGRKRLFLAGIVLFGIGSLAAALSTSMAMLIASRAIMGVAGAVALPQTLSIIKASFTEPNDRTKAIGIWAGIFGLGYGIGPAVGGVLLEYFEWYSVFLINIPISIIAFLGAYLYISESRDEEAPRLDLVGVTLSIAALFSVVYGITKAGEESWTHNSVIVWLSIGAVLLTVFVLWEKRSSHPLLPLRFFRNMSFTGPNIGMTLAALGVFSLLWFVSQYLQSVQGYSALEAAVRLLPTAVFILIVASLGSTVARAVGVKLPVSLGMLICGLGFFYMSFLEADTSYVVVLGGLLLIGGGYGLAWTPSTDSIMGSVPERRAGIGSAMDQTTQCVGGVLGVAALGSIMNGIYREGVEGLRTVLALPDEVHSTIESGIQSAHIVASELPEDAKQLVMAETSEAYTSGMTEAMFVAGIVLVASSLVTLLILPNRIRPSEE
jgi:EmrB/QacA subfamily drug resistance transporter